MDKIEAAMSSKSPRTPSTGSGANAKCNKCGTTGHSGGYHSCPFKSLGNTKARRLGAIAVAKGGDFGAAVAAVLAEDTTED